MNRTKKASGASGAVIRHVRLMLDTFITTEGQGRKAMRRPLARARLFHDASKQESPLTLKSQVEIIQKVRNKCSVRIPINDTHTHTHTHTHISNAATFHVPLNSQTELTIYID